jgi:hypothetical protein
MGGVTIGFFCGLFVTYGTEMLGDWLEVSSQLPQHVSAELKAPRAPPTPPGTR